MSSERWTFDHHAGGKKAPFWLKPGWQSPSLIGKEETELLELRGVFARRLCDLLWDVRRGKRENADFNCHDAAEHLLRGVGIGYHADKFGRGILMSVGEALDQLVTPCGIQIYKDDKTISHSAVLLGGDTDNVPLVLHKPGRFPLQVCTYEEMIDEYRHNYYYATFSGQWRESGFRAGLRRWLRSRKTPESPGTATKGDPYNPSGFYC